MSGNKDYFLARFFRFLFIIFLCIPFASIAAKHGGRVVRAQFSTSIEQREPVDDVVFLDASSSEVYFFTEILSMTGYKVFHRWEHNGQVVSKVSFDIGGPRWRINTKKRLDPSSAGIWTVVVTDGDGWPLAARMFIYGDEAKNKYLENLRNSESAGVDVIENKSEQTIEGSGLSN